jgi:hypothetical protein
MLIAGALTFDAQGRILCTLEPPDDFNGGTPVKDGLLCISPNAPDSYLGGLAYAAIDFICSSQETSDPNPDGPPLSGPHGRLKATANAPTYWYAGLPFAANGLLSLVLAVPPPVDEGAYSSAYSLAFDVLEP